MFRGGFILCIVRVILKDSWDVVIEDFLYNSKAIGGEDYSYATLSKLLIKKKSFRNVFIYRISNAVGTKMIRGIVKLFYKPLDTIEIWGNIDGGVRINHNFAIINAEHIGKNFVCNQGVTITAAKRGVERPIIGDDCFVGANAVILGPCHIGNNVMVGAGSLVRDIDVPDNCMVVGNPCRIVRKNEDTYML